MTGTLYVLLLLLLATTAAGATTLTQRVRIGKDQARALWTPAFVAESAEIAESKGKQPTVLLIPGSGPNGPEEMMPGKLTEDGKPHPLFEQIAAPFMENGWNVLCLGKPGIEFFQH
jgi:hypothetical protein